MIFGSVCSGIEAASVAWHPLGWRAAFLSEIEAFPRAVLAHHYPSTPLHGDFTTIEAGMYEPIELLVGGTPCQSFSVAGKRLGLDDPRGHLTLEFLALARRLRPRFIVWENVPGAASDDDGETLMAIMDTLEELGYVCDLDILDAQFFGVPQRRRRIFICGQSVESILTQRTISSGLTIAQCLAESLLLALAVLSGRSLPDSESLTFDASDAVRSLQRRMQLFGLDQDGQASILLGNLAAIPPSSAPALGGSASPHGKPLAGGCGHSGDTASAASPLEGDGYPNIAWSLPTALAESLRILSECITSTATSGTTDQKIYTCARTLLLIAERITPSTDSSPCFWSAGLSTLTALREFTDYARSASSDLFTPMEWLHPWADFVEQAERAMQSLGSLGVRPRTDTVLPLSDSLSGHPAPRREAGERPAPTIASRPTGGGGLGTDFDCDGGYQPSVAGCLGTEVPGSRMRCDASDNLIAGDVADALRADGFDASEDGTGRGTPLVPVSVALRGREGGATAEMGDEVAHALRGSQGGGDKPHVLAFDTTQVTSKANYSRPRAGDTDHPLTAGAHPPAIAFTNRGIETEGGAERLRAASHGALPMVAQTLVSNGDAHSGFRDERGLGNESAPQSMAVRRLTPRECERLQGFPDDYTRVPYRGKPAADGPRYKALGNSMAVPVMRWLGERIEAVEEACLRAEIEGAA